MIFGGHDVLVRVIRNLKIIMAYLSCSLAGVSLFSACNSREKITEVTVSPVVKEIDDSIHAGSAHSAELMTAVSRKRVTATCIMKSIFEN